MARIKSKLVASGATLAVLGLAVAAVAPALAAEVGTGTDTTPATWTQTVEIGSASKISIASNATTTATIPALAGSSGGFAVAPPTDLVVATNDARGSQLTLNISNNGAANGAGTVNTLSSTGSTTNVTAISGTTLTGGSNGGDWGFTFVTNDTNRWSNAVASATNVVPTASSAFYAVPVITAPITLLSDSNAAGSRTGWVNYGAVVTYALEAGHTYTNTVQYTASIVP